MIIVEPYFQDGVQFNKIYSDKNRLIERDGHTYLELIEPTPTVPEDFSEGEYYGEAAAKDILGILLGEDET